MIVKNEARVLERCLQSCRGIADEIIVVDTGSTDSSVDIAHTNGARVIQSDWKNDFSFSRNISLEHASCVWILWLDADDVVPIESVAIINALKKQPPSEVFGFIVKNQKPGGTGTEFVQARMFPNDPRIRFERRIHEQILLSALRIGLKLKEKPAAVIEHHGYADPAAMSEKALRNVTLLLKEYEINGPDPVMAVEIADSYLITGDRQNALQWYCVTLAIPYCQSTFPHIAAQAYLGWGNILNKDEDHKNAADKFLRSLKLSPDRVDTLYSLAVALDAQGQKEEALELLRRIVSTPTRPISVGVDFREAKIKSMLRMERILTELGRHEDVLTLAQNALSLFAHRPEIQNMAGRAYLKSNRLMDALHAFEKSLQFETLKNVDAYIGLCEVYLKAGKRNVAEQTIIAHRDLFARSPRYWAFYKQLYGALPPGVVPDMVDGKDIEGETAYLKVIFKS
jgi:glycosyltransferase involved in cell wall biosynthesis